MDYFYVACEELRRPEIKGKAVIVGADPKNGRGRGVVMTCSYAARRYGIKSAMPISVAYRIKPDATYLPMDYAYYEKISLKVMNLIREFSGAFEQVSIDEAYVELAGGAASLEEAERLAYKIKGSIKEEIGLDCSIGVSFNKLMAKMASDAAKPNGIKIVKESEAQAFLENMPLDKLYSIGSKTRDKLESMGFHSVGELAKANKMEIMAEFGSAGLELHNYANGIDESKLLGAYDPKSIGREMTFEDDTSDIKAVSDSLKRLSNEVAAEAGRAGFAFKNVTVKLRYSDFSERLHSRAIKPSEEPLELYGTAEKLYLDNVEKGRKLRKIGVRVSGLMKYAGQRRLG